MLQCKMQAWLGYRLLIYLGLILLVQIHTLCLDVQVLHILLRSYLHSPFYFDVHCRRSLALLQWPNSPQGSLMFHLI